MTASEGFEAHLEAIREELAAARDKADELQEEKAELERELASDAAEIEELEEAGRRAETLASAIWRELERRHVSARHRGPLRYCMDEACDGWDLVMKGEGVSWPPA